MRKVVNINEGWLFAKSAEVPRVLPQGVGWERVNLPHTWNAEDGQDGGNDYWRGPAVYTQVLDETLLREGCRVYLECRGAALAAEVYLNGRKLARHEGGFSAFRVDLTDALAEDGNLLAIVVDNSENWSIYPQRADFTFYGGLYRDVNLILTEEAHFALTPDGTPGMQVMPTRVRDGVWDVTVRTRSCGADRIEFLLRDLEGHICASQSAHVDAGAEGQTLEKTLRLSDVHLWDGLEDPYLYSAEALLYVDGREEAADAVRLTFGCRTAVVDPEKGFLLNGRSYPLRGVSRHQDRKGAGNALTLSMMREDMDVVLESGANSLRLAHYQQAQEFYDLCDEYGIVVWAEIPFITQFMPEGEENTLQQMRELIVQSAHHPSIVCWGLSNEITVAGGVTDALLENHRQLNDLCHQMDPTRFTVMANAFMLETDSPLLSIPDVNSYNLYYGWYLGELQDNDAFFDRWRQEFPDRAIGFSEYGADANPSVHAEHPEQGDYSEEYQCLYHEHMLRMIEERPYLWSTYVWNLFDFAADGREEGGRKGENQKGLVCFDHSTRKDAFYLYKAAWNRRDHFVHLCGKRFVHRSGEMTKIKAYSNLPLVVLRADGRELSVTKDRYIYTAELSLDQFEYDQPIRIEATASCDGRKITDTMEIVRTKEPDPAYYVEGRAPVVNWFDRDQLNPEYYSIQDTMGELMQNPKTGALIGRIMDKAAASRGDVAKSSQDNANLQRMMAGTPFIKLLQQAGAKVVSPEQIRELNEMFQKIPKK